MNIKTTLWRPLAALLTVMMGLSGSISATDITFSVDMNSYGSSFTTAYVAGSFNGWTDANPLVETAPGSGIWETTVDIPEGNLEYKFMLDNWAADESLTAGTPCTVTTGGFTNRFLIVGPDPVVLDTVCYGSCVGCDVVLPTYMVTFQVDMNSYTGPWSSVQINGTFNGWCGVCNPMEETAPGSGVFATTIELEESAIIEYKFTVDATTGTEYYETLAEGGSCTLTTDGFTNRVLTVSADETLAVVCFESCEACGSGGVPNDAACDAIEVMVGDTIVADNTGATADGPFASCWIDTDVEADIWYFFTAPSSGIVEIETIDIGGSDDTQVAIYSSSDGTCNGTLTEVGCGDDISGTDYMSFAEVSGLTPGDTYWIQIDGWQGTEGEFELSVQPVTNDEACSAFSVTVDGGPIVADNTGATPDGPFASCWIDTEVEADIWYFFTAPATGAVDIETVDIGGSDDTQVAVYSSSDGTCTGELTEVGCGDDISGTDYMSFVEVSGLTPGDTYWIQIDGWQGTEGEFELLVTSAGEVPCPAPDAVICDNMDSYELGTIAGQAAHWAPWPGGTVVAEVTDEQAFSNGQSLKVGPGGVEDNLLLLNDETSGTWTLSWKMYVPADATGFFNIQADPTIGNAFIYQCFLNAGGAEPGVGSFQQLPETFTYPEDEWFDVEIIVDMDNLVHSLSIAGTAVLTDAPYVSNAGPGPASTLTAINFYSIDADNTYYLDDVIYDGVGAIDPCPSPDAVICDNVDSYELGSIEGQAAHWAPWPGGTVVATVTDEQAFSNTQSLKVGPGGVEDNLLLLNDETTGNWTISWKMYVPADATGFFNIQADPTIGNAFIYQCFLNAGGAEPGVGSFQQLPETFTYPEDAWFDVEISVDMNNLVHSLSIDGTAVLTDAPYVSNAGPGPATTLTAINFYSIDADNTYYLDDIIYDGDPAVGLPEFVEGNFRIYPNPTNGLFTVEGEENIEAVVVRNVLGATVVQLQSNFSNRVELDLTGLNNGLYFVEITVDDVVSVQRLIKQ